MRWAIAAVVVAVVLAAPGGADAVDAITVGPLTYFAGRVVPGRWPILGPAVGRPLQQPVSLALDAAGDVFVAEYSGNDVIEIDPQGVIKTVAGTGTPGFSGDGGPATQAQLFGPLAVAVDRAGNLYIADSQNERVRRVDAHGVITTIAGHPAADNQSGPGTPSSQGIGQDGPALSTEFASPAGLAVDRAGDVLVSDHFNDRVRAITPAGVIYTVAGYSGHGLDASGAPLSPASGLGDGGPAAGASVWNPMKLSLDGQGNLYIADRGHASIRKVTPGGLISTVAGTGSPGTSDDGIAATAAELNQPASAVVDAKGDLLIADAGNDALRAVTPDGIIHSVTTGPNEGTLPSPDEIVADAYGGVYLLYQGAAEILRFGGRRVTASQVLSLPSAHTCTSRRAFPIHIRQVPGVTYVSATVALHGKRLAVYVYTAKRRLKTTKVAAAYLNVKRLRAYVDLHGRVRGAYKLKITVTTSSGQTLTGTRTYHTCSASGRLKGSLPRL
jgi:sugar lactone lactonase YvrE